ncbi:MAG: hypothetical protein H0V67_08525, partial [Geodermatophilaceae bacterium]|nr:hypothetical protein [Geodermatophilaceae bacterium]
MPTGPLSEGSRRVFQSANAHRRLGGGVLAGLAMSSLIAGSSVSGAAAAPDRALASQRLGTDPLVGVGAQPSLLGYPWAMVPDNAGKDNGALPGVTTTSSTTRTTVPVSEISDLGIPDVALEAYRTAAAYMDEADAACRIDWSLIAGVGRVESDHGQYGGRRPAADGAVQPPIVGIALDGRPGVALIRDTDGGRLDFDTTYDRAVGPMQFIPGTWSAFPDADGDGDGVADPHNLFDAALAAASYLCSGPGDLSTEAGQRSAVFRYNHSDTYVNTVLSYAQAYAAGVVPSGPPPQPAGPPPAVPEDPVTDPAHPGDPLPGNPGAPPTTTPPTTTPPTTTTRPTRPTTSAPPSATGTPDPTGTPD